MNPYIIIAIDMFALAPLMLVLFMQRRRIKTLIEDKAELYRRIDSVEWELFALEEERDNLKEVLAETRKKLEEIRVQYSGDAR